MSVIINEAVGYFDGGIVCLYAEMICVMN